MCLCKISILECKWMFALFTITFFTVEVYVFNHLSSSLPSEESQAAGVHAAVKEQLAITNGFEDLDDHRKLVESRYDHVKAFAVADDPPGISLSPGAKKIKDDFFRPSDGKLSENHIKVFAKKFKSLVQLVNNATESLHSVHREICNLLRDYSEGFGSK